MWGLIALFVVIGVIGLLALLLVSFPRSATTQVAGPATPNTVLSGPASDEAALPAEGSSGDPAAPNAEQTTTTTPVATTAPTGSSIDPTAPVTVPGGALAPAGVREVLVADGATSFTFDVGGEFPAATATTAVAPTRAVAGPDGASLAVSVGCATSADEVLAQISVGEGPSAVTVVAVVLVPPGGRPCDPDDPRRQVDIPLAQPLGLRSVVIVPAGTPIPQLAGPA